MAEYALRFDHLRQWLHGRLTLAKPADSPDAGKEKAAAKTWRQRLFLSAMIFLVALGVRLLYLQDSRAELVREDTVLKGMAYFYEHEAQRVIEEGGVLIPNIPREAGDAWMVVHPPGYSILLAGFYKIIGASDISGGLDDAEAWMRGVQILCDSAAATIVFFIAAEFFPLALACISGLLVAFSPHFAYYSLGASPDTLAVLPILLAIYLFIRGYKRPRLIMVIGAGAMIGLSCWLRANALLLTPFLTLFILLFFERGRRWRYALALVAAAALVIVPITVRNFIVYKTFLPLSIGAGITLIEGIADYDGERRFAMPANDTEACAKDVEWHNRPDYDRSPWLPDGVERDRYRLRRGLDVIRTNPLWFFGVMLKRTECTLRYNDFRPEAGHFCVSSAPVISDAPGFASEGESTADKSPVWSSAPAEILSIGTIVSPQAQVSLAGDKLQIIGDDSAQAEQFSSPLFAVRKKTDFVLTIPVELERGAITIMVKGADPRTTLAQSNTSAIPKKKKREAENRNEDSEKSPLSLAQIHFASGDLDYVRFVIANYDAASVRPVVRLGQAKLFELGPTPNQWTRPPRSLIRGIQKNLYKTNVMRLLIVTGIALLILAKWGNALAFLLVVPLYYLSVQSIFHTEYRYILAIHYFLFIFAAAAVYLFGMAISQLMWQKGTKRGLPD